MKQTIYSISSEDITALKGDYKTSFAILIADYRLHREKFNFSSDKAAYHSFREVSIIEAKYKQLVRDGLAKVTTEQQNSDTAKGNTDFYKRALNEIEKNLPEYCLELNSASLSVIT